MKTFIIIFSFFFTLNVFATSSPKPGMKAPQHFIEFHNYIQSEYQKGFWAERFNKRRELQEKISNGLIPANALSVDTTYALTLLGRYSDSNPRYSRVQLQQKLFDGPNPSGTITDYYSEISYGQLYFSGQCQGWFGVPGTMQSYVGNNNGLGVNGGPKFVYDLVKAADSSIDFSKHIQYYDNEGTPHIGFIAAIHTGADAAAGATNIWSHRWNFRMHTGNKPYTTNDIDPISGKKVLIDGDYAIQPEMNGSDNFSGTLIDIGVFCHEFGHIFGLPDLYDTDNSSEGLGNWCLMGAGSWNTPTSPAHMSAWCKIRLGWIVPITINSFQKDFVVKNTRDFPVAYKIWRDGVFNKEYFLIENRQKLGFDKNLYKEGLLIFHVDENMTNNTNENHYMVDLEQADGLRDLNMKRNRGDAGDCFPGSTGNTRFDLGSNPNSRDYTSANTFVSVRGIRHSGLDMIVDFDIGTKPYVILKSVIVDESGGIKNGRIEQGESANISFVLSNIERTNSNATSFKFNFDDLNINVLTPNTNVAVNAYQQVNGIIDNAFSVGNQFESRPIYIKFEVDGGGSKYFDSLRIVLGIPKILLVSKAEKISLMSYYESSLTNANKYFEDLFNQTPRYYYGREILIWNSGRNKDSVFTSSEIDSLSSFLDRGGKLLLSGQNIAEFLNSFSPSFLQNRLGINYLRNSGIFTSKVYGISTDLFGKDVTTLRINGGEGAANETSMDIIESRGNFNLSFAYKTDGTDGAGGWIFNPTNNSKIFFMGFGFESINNTESSISRDKLLQNILSWFDPTTEVKETNIFSDFHLYQNYPNPFNSVSNIRYKIAESCNARLSIYDILGREVFVLLDEQKAPGTYNLTFDASSLSSGLYFYKLQAGNFSATKKLMLLK